MAKNGTVGRPTNAPPFQLPRTNPGTPTGRPNSPTPFQLPRTDRAPKD